MAIDTDELLNKSSFDNKIAQGMSNGEWLSVQARTGDARYNGDAYIVVSTSDVSEYERFQSIDTMLDEYNRIIEKYGIGE